MDKKKAFSIDVEVYNNFKAVAKEEGMNLSKLVEKLMQTYIDLSKGYPSSIGRE